MARSRDEVRAYLERSVGQSIDANCGQYNGQCVSLIKGLMNFLGVPNPYAARGNAKDCGDTLLRQGIAQPGVGWLTVVVNRDMGLIDGIRYGHIWVDLKNEANYEQNGRTALRTTKNTRPIQQGQQFINLDKWIGNDMIIGKDISYDVLNRLHVQIVGNWNMSKEYWDSIQGREFSKLILEWSNHPAAPTAMAQQALGEHATKDKWAEQIYSLQDALKARPTKEQLEQAQKSVQEISAQLENAKKEILEYEKKETGDKEAADTWLRRLGQFLSKYWVAK